MANETILVVDDNPLNLKLTRILLETHGYRVVTAADGPEALAAAERVMPRLILLDVELRGIDGIEVARRIKAAPRTQGVIVVALTARATKADESEARAAGCDGYIKKPIDAARFPEQIRDYIDSAAAPKKWSVLVVDQNLSRAKVLGKALQEQGYIVAYARNDTQALAAAKAEIDIVICDVLVPHLGGFRLCQSIRQDDSLRRAAIVLLASNHVQAADERLARRMGANSIVSHDEDLRDLITTLDRALEEGPVDVPMASDELAAIREEFLVTGARDSHRLAVDGINESNAVAAKRLCHAWASSGGTLGFPQISRAALHLEQLLDSGMALDLTKDLGQLADMFRRVRNGSGDAPSVWVSGILKNRRIAIYGFPQDELLTVLKQLKAAGAVAELTESTEPADLMSSELLVAAGSRGGLTDLTGIEIPVLFVGETTKFYPRDGFAGVHDLLVKPWTADEIIVRCHKLLTGVGYNRPVQPRRNTTPEILIADDDPTIATIVQSILEGHGMLCRTTDRGGSVVQLAETQVPDAIVLDVNLPELDGFQVLSRIRNHPTLQDCLVVLLTARQQETDIIKGFGLGADDYVVKPFSPMELVARLQRLLKERARQYAVAS
jgi:CheY-like chemotaxis protein